MCNSGRLSLFGIQDLKTFWKGRTLCGDIELTLKQTTPSWKQNTTQFNKVFRNIIL